jgi:hypothetical protein
MTEVDGTASSPGEGDGPLTDIAVIAAQPLLRRSRWLQAVVCGEPSEEFIVREITGTRPQASGGDVLIRVMPAGTRPRVPRVEVWAVAQHAVVPVAAWENLPAGCWPEVVRPPVAFAMTALTQMSEIVTLGTPYPVPLRHRRFGGPVGLPTLIWPIRPLRT